MRSSTFLAVFIVYVFATMSRAQSPPMVEQYLTIGKLAEGEAALTQHLQQNPSDDQARFGLGTLQVIRAVEGLMQDLYAAGLRSEGSGLPFVRLPVPDNPNPKPFSYEDAGKMIRRWNDGLAKAQATLEGVKSADVKLPLHFGLIRMDFDGDGKASEDETLWKVYARVSGQEAIPPEQAASFVIAFDAGDVQWLRGYCHLLMGVNEIALAYDEKELFDSTAHLFFRNAQTPYPFLKSGQKVFEMQQVDIADAIAFIHLLRCPVKDPARMKAALDHFEATLRCSRESWKLILAETDNDHEWIPNAKQESVIPNVKVTQTMIDHWQKFLDESQSLLAGKTLAPFWRGDGGKGVNLRKVFTEPTTLDPVLWIQGTAAAPYLEQGTITDPGTWKDIWGAFGRESFLGFAVWFN